mmetsp:Transcript_20014/g.25931  ORF Transcript_20014/g.25931 Transcript_20014/m.25931 type:complete len:615 (+) Transcript_20014:1590-3434(+)
MTSNGCLRNRRRHLCKSLSSVRVYESNCKSLPFLTHFRNILYFVVCTLVSYFCGSAWYLHWVYQYLYSIRSVKMFSSFSFGGKSTAEAYTNSSLMIYDCADEKDLPAPPKGKVWVRDTDTGVWALMPEPCKANTAVATSKHFPIMASNSHKHRDRSGSTSSLSIKLNNRKGKIDDKSIDDDDDEEEAIAKFWSNPVLGLDNDVNLMDEVPDESRRRRRPRPRRSFKNINKTRSPSFLKDFYNTLFWYGIEFEDENDDAYEPSSIFGGTRGKFDGRKYIEGDDTINGSNDDNDDLDNFPVRGRRRQQPLQSRQGINDRYNVSGTRKRRQRPPSSRRGAAYLREEWSEKSWTEEEVSSWFDDDDASDSTYQQRRKYFADDMFNDLRRADHKRRKKAAEWDESYAFDINRSRISRESQPDLENIVDVEVQVEKTKNDEKKINGIDGAERQNRSRKFESNQDQVSVEQRAKIKEKEDAEKRERVPPNGIVAWGPLGEIKGKDVRQKAAEEAIDQIKNAQISLEKQKAKLIAAEERMQVTRVTAVLQRKRISERTDYISASEGAQLRRSLRELDLEVSKEKRRLREAREATNIAEIRLNELNSKYDALMTMYNSTLSSS